MPAGSSAAGVLSDEFFPPSAPAANSSSGMHQQDLDPEFKRKLESWERIRSSSGVGKKKTSKVIKSRMKK